MVNVLEEGPSPGGVLSALVPPPVPTIGSDDPTVQFVEGSVRVLHNTPRSQVSIARLLATGSGWDFGENKVSAHGQEDALVVLKRTKIRGSTCLARFEREKNALVSCVHAHVVRPLAVLSQAPVYGFLLPYFERGSLHDALHDLSPSHRQTRLIFRDSWQIRAHVALDIARALEYLHARGIAHRDIKPANVLLDRHFIAQLTDFECARDKHAPKKKIQAYSGPSGGFFKDSFVGTLLYMAPEIFLKAPSPSLEAADMYAFGVLLNEMGTGCIPYSDVRTTAEQLHTVVEANYSRQDLMKAVCNNQLRPNTPRDVKQDEWTATCPDEWTDLSTACWNATAESRPSAAEALARARSFVEEVQIPKRREIADALVVAHSAVPLNVDGDTTMVDVLESSELPTLAIGAEVEGLSAVEMRAGGYAQQGKRHSMEDAFFVRKLGVGSILGIFDGHGGADMALYAKEKLGAILEAELAKISDIVVAIARNEGDAAIERVSAALKASFVETDASWARYNARLLREGKRAEVDGSGCTALVALVLGHMVWVASAGDCRCVCYASDGSHRVLNVEHHPELAEERARIERAGGSLKRSSDGLLRVNGHLRVSRALGDCAFKPYGVTSEPDVSCFPLTGSERYLVMGTDGLFDVLENAQIASLLDRTVKHEDFGAKRLVMEALALGTIDNVTSIVTYFDF